MKEIDPKPIEPDDDPLVLAYRFGGFNKTSETVRVRRSELSKDPNLFELSRSARSLGFEPKKSLEARFKEKREYDPYVRIKIEYELMLKESRRRIREENLTLDALPKDLEITSINDLAAQQILTIVTNQLIKEGLWIDEYKDLTMSEAFPLSQAKSDSKIRADILDRGTFLIDSDLTHEDRAAEDSPQSLMNTAPQLKRPILSSPMIHNLMRASPRDLEHQIARRMIDSNYFEDHPEDAYLYRCCYFFSKGFEDELHFDCLLRAGLNHEFPHYTFQDFRIERLKLKKRIRLLIETFFLDNPAVKEKLKLRPEPDKSDPRNFWKRFYQVWNSLTKKQMEALELVHIGEPQITKKQAADFLGITFDSLKDRIKVAIRRFKFEFWELEGISPKRMPRKMLKAPVTHNGLWRYETAALKATLYKVDPRNDANDSKVEIDWKVLPRSKNLDWKTIARIKAEIIENCPVPQFHETEYFDGMKPTILSFSRIPGNLSGIKTNK